MESTTIDEAKLFALIGERIKRRRIARKQTQAWLAGRAGVLRTSVTNIETGRQKVPLHVLYALCNALEVDPLDVLPSLAEVQRATDQEQEVVIGDERVVLPRRAAEVLRGAIDESPRSTS